jgi:outer membrane protein assembly factor BamB
MTQRRLSFIGSLTLAACLGSFVQAENWDRFRGPNGAGQSDAAGIPSEWKPSHFLWRAEMPGIGHGSPVIWNKRLFLVSGNADSGEQIIQAFDSLNGKPLWERRVPSGTYRKHGFNSYASSTPAVDEHHVYVIWLDNGRVKIGAWTHDGNEVWQREIGEFEETHGFGKSPIVIDGVVWIANDSDAQSAIIALDAISGDERWRIPRPSGNTPFATPFLLNPAAKSKQLIFISTAAGLTGVDIGSGQVIWQGLKEAVPLRVVSSPIVSHGLILFTCGQGGNGKWLVAAKPGDAEHEPREVYRLDQNIPNVPTPVVAGDLFFLWHDRGVVSCHDVATGRQHWRQRVGGDFHSSPIRIGDRIFAASRGGEVVVLAASQNYHLLARNVLDEPCHATPAVADNRLYVRTESTLYCIGTPASAAE